MFQLIQQDTLHNCKEYHQIFTIYTLKELVMKLSLKEKKLACTFYVNSMYRAPTHFVHMVFLASFILSGHLFHD